MEKYILKKFEALNPCSEGMMYIKNFLTPKEAWQYCKNANWMAWYLHKNVSRDILIKTLYEEVKNTIKVDEIFLDILNDSNTALGFINIWIDKKHNKAIKSSEILNTIGQKYAETKDMNYGCLYMFIKTIDFIEHCSEVFEKLAFLKNFDSDFPTSNYIRTLFPNPPDLKNS